MSLMALRSNYSLAGAVCMSGYLPLATQPPEMSPANERTPVFMCHGDEDNVVRAPSAALLPYKRRIRLCLGCRRPTSGRPCSCATATRTTWCGRPLLLACKLKLKGETKRHDFHCEVLLYLPSHAFCSVACVMLPRAPVFRAAAPWAEPRVFSLSSHIACGWMYHSQVAVRVAAQMVIAGARKHLG